MGVVILSEFKFSKYTGVTNPKMNYCAHFLSKFKKNITKMHVMVVKTVPITRNRLGNKIHNYASPAKHGLLWSQNWNALKSAAQRICKEILKNKKEYVKKF